MHGAFPSFYGRIRAVRVFRVQKWVLSSDFATTIPLSLIAVQGSVELLKNSMSFSCDLLYLGILRKNQVRD
jgi:hypothetical protein